MEGWIIMFPCPAREFGVHVYATADKNVETAEMEKAYVFPTMREAQLRANKHPRAKSKLAKPRLIKVS